MTNIDLIFIYVCILILIKPVLETFGDILKSHLRRWFLK